MTAVRPAASRRRSCRFGSLLIDFDPRVLTPRPWTIAQSTWAAELATTCAAGPLLELCAGAGQIGLAAAVLADRDLVQVEADPVAAGYARFNAERAGRGDRTEVRIARLETALEPGEEFELIIADPPYLPSAAIERWPDDPAPAIDGGPDGFDLVAACLRVADGHLADRGWLLLQVAGPAQGDAVERALTDSSFRLAAGERRVIDDERAILQVGRR